MCKLINKRTIKIIIFLTCALFTLSACDVKNGAELTQDEKNDSTSNYLEQKSSEGSNEANTQNAKSNKKNNKTTIIASENDDVGIEYDVYKKIDLSEFVDRKIEGLNEGRIDRVEGGLFLSNAPCKITVKANVKIERGSAFPSENINDLLSTTVVLGPIYSQIYYADYNDNYFDEFHEIERSSEFFNGSNGKGKIFFSKLGISSLRGATNYKIKVVSNSDTEFVGEFFAINGGQTIAKVTIKDVYYKVGKPTGTVTDWDLDRDFEVSNFYGNQAFVMRELEDGYTYIIKPKFTYTVNNEYDDRKTKYLTFNYISDNKTSEYATRIMSERENDIDVKYNKIGIGMAKSDWKKKDANNAEDFIMSWDKDTHTVIVNGKNGDNIANIKIDYIKEYKYKNCIENETPGYKKYLMATVQNNTKMAIEKEEEFKYVESTKIKDPDLIRSYEEVESRTIKETGEKREKNLVINGHAVKYSIPLVSCKNIPNINNYIEQAIDGAATYFLPEFFQNTGKDSLELICNAIPPIYYSYELIGNDVANILSIIFGAPSDNSSLSFTIKLNLSTLEYFYDAYWNNAHNLPESAPITEKMKSSHGSKYSLGYEPLIADWNLQFDGSYAPIANANIGDYINFGEYIYNGRFDNDHSLEWLVLDKKNDELLITTYHVIETPKGCYTSDLSTTIGINEWLNTTFFNAAYNSKQKAQIVGEGEKVFLLDFDEVSTYFSDDKSRQCKATTHARRNWCWYSIKNGMCGCCYYFLRTPGSDLGDGKNRLMVVNEYGGINTTGMDKKEEFVGIRPAMWIKTN